MLETKIYFYFSLIIQSDASICQIIASEFLSAFDSWDMLIELVLGPLQEFLQKKAFHRYLLL